MTNQPARTASYPLPSDDDHDAPDDCQCIPASEQGPRIHCDQHPR